MPETSTFQYLLYAILAANILMSLWAFNNRKIFDQFKFNIGSILGHKQYYRLFTSAFIHGSMMHLAFNMFALYTFALSLEWYFTATEFAILYFVSLFVGNLLPLYFHRNEPHYSAVGASGAVSGVIYASILLFPEGTIFLYFFPIKSWIFGILYLLYTMYSIRRKGDNIGHEAHLGGAVAGVVIAYIFEPQIVQQNWWVALLIFIPMGLFFLVAWLKPSLLSGKPTPKFRAKNIGTNSSKRKIDDLYVNKEWEREKEMNALLEKINTKGIESLTEKEKQRIRELSK